MMIFRRNHERRAVWSEPSSKRESRENLRRAEIEQSVSKFKIDTIISSNLDLEFSEIKDSITVPNPWNPSIKIFDEKTMNQTASNLNVESQWAWSNCLNFKAHTHWPSDITLTDSLTVRWSTKVSHSRCIKWVSQTLMMHFRDPPGNKYVVHDWCATGT